MQRLQATVYGQVHGVGFRAAAQAEANRLGVSGWVANRYDGTVEVVAEGPDNALHRLERWLQQGPPSARVERVETYWDDGSGEFRGVQVR